MSEMVRLGDVLRIKHGFAFPGDGFHDHSGMPQVVTPGNFAVGGGFRIGKGKSFAGPYPPEYDLAPGSLVVTMTDLSKEGDTLGLPAIIPTDGHYLHNQRIGLVKVTEPRSVNESFLSYYLRTQSYRSFVLGTASGSTVRHTSPGRIESFIATLPTLNEQQAIADVLGALDDKIAANTKIRETVDLYLETLLQGFLSPDSEWTTLAAVAEVNASSARPVECGNLRYIDIASVNVGSFDLPDEIGWNTAPGRARRKVSHGDILWSTVRPNRRSHGLNLHSDENIVASTGLAVISPTNAGFAYVYEATRRPEFTSYLETVAEGSAYPAVKAERFLGAPVPDIDEEPKARFETIASKLRLSVCAAESESRTIANLRDTLLPQLMSGKLRVRDAERTLSEVL